MKIILALAIALLLVPVLVPQAAAHGGRALVTKQSDGTDLCYVVTTAAGATYWLETNGYTRAVHAAKGYVQGYDGVNHGPYMADHVPGHDDVVTPLLRGDLKTDLQMISVTLGSDVYPADTQVDEATWLASCAA